jgi:hypothetical protein
VAATGVAARRRCGRDIQAHRLERGPAAGAAAQLAHNVAVALTGVLHVRAVVLAGGDQYAAAGAAGATAWSDRADHTRRSEAGPQRH